MSKFRRFLSVMLPLATFALAGNSWAQTPTILVTNTADSGAGSLRQAIIAANATSGRQITFNIPAADAGFASGVFTIRLVTTLPFITAANTSINGGTQTAFTGDTNPSGPEVVLNATSVASGGSVLTIDRTTGCTISGLVVNGLFSGYGITISNILNGNNTIRDNYVGTDASGTSAVANFANIYIYNSSGNLVGNDGESQLGPNRVGFARSFGIWCQQDSKDNVIRQNTVFSNGDDGIFMGYDAGVTGNLIEWNETYGNGGLGINLSGGTENNRVTTNDPLDADTGPNNLQNFPIITSVDSGRGNTVLAGTLSSTPSTQFTIEVYRNSAATSADASAFGEGEVYLGNTDVSTDNTGVGSFGFTVSGLFPGQTFTATATNSFTLDTSEFGPNTSSNQSGFVVTNTANGGPGSLRNAINAVNSVPGSTIVFNIPTTDSGFVGGVFNINLTTVLPLVRASGTIIDGSTQTAFTGNTNTSGPEVLINGSGIGSGAALIEITGATNCLVKGLVLSGLTSGAGVRISSSLLGGNRIEGNYLGTNAAGTAALPNFYGVVLYDTSENLVGGTTAGTANRIAYNRTSGIFCQYSRNGNEITGNIIHNNGDDGVFVGFAADTAGITIRDNSIYSNGGLGINLSGGVEVNRVTPNDTNDVDTGSNGLQNYPVITGVLPSAGSSSLTGTLNSIPSTNFTLDFYSNSTATGFDASGHGEGQTYLGSTSATTDASGNASFSFTATGTFTTETFTATATDLSTGATSEFGPNTSAQVAGFVVTNTNDSGPGSLRNAINVANNLPGSTVSFNIPNTDSGFASGVFTINLASILPSIVAPNTQVDGNTQTTFTGNTNPAGPEVVVNATGVTSGGGIFTVQNTTGVTIKNLVISGLTNGAGISIQNRNLAGHKIEGNYLGTNAAGTAGIPNFYGIFLSSSTGNTIGGDTAAKANLIGFNRQEGVLLQFGGPNLVQGNNIISNGGSGIRVGFGNTVNGVNMTANTFKNNGGIAIDLSGGTEQNAVTRNDIDDSDTGPNGLQNFPVITGVVPSGGNTVISGVLNSVPSTNFRVEFFRNTTAVGGDPSGFGEGEIYLGSVNTASGADGAAPFTFSSPGTFPGQVFTATATNLTTGDTSEFGPGNSSALAGYIVTNTNDSGAGSLRNAILVANSLPGTTVSFNIPTSDPRFANGVFTIGLSSTLPAIVNPGTIINGATQTTFGGNTNPLGPEVVVSGAGLTVGGSLLTVNAAQNCVISNLVVSGLTNGSGITVQGNSAGTKIESNYIGTDAAGTAAAANFYGILLNSTGNITIGGTTAAQANRIGFNRSHGILIQSSAQNLVSNNTIFRNGNHGILLGYDTSAVGNTLAANSLYANGDLGINLSGGRELNGITSNDGGDADTGTNDLQNHPVLTGVTPGTSNTTLSGTLDSTPSTNFKLEFFRNTTATGTDGSGFGEGEFYLGSANVTTDGTGKVSFSQAFTGLFPGDSFTGTATNLTTGSTSELGPNTSAQVAGYIVTNTNDSGPGSLRNAVNVANSLPGTTISFRIPTSDANFASGVFTIRTASALPPIVTSNTVIDGATQTNFTGNTNTLGPEVVLNGSGTSAGGGFLILRGVSGCLIRGLVINGYRNGQGISVENCVAPANRIESNYIGTDASGTSGSANFYGVVFTNSSATSLGGVGVGNRIGFNTSYGVLVNNSTSNSRVTENIVFGNGSHGIYLAFNATGVGNTLSRNSIYSNSALGIDIYSATDPANGVTANDALDADTGVNNLQNFPLITNVTDSAGSTSIAGTFNSLPSTTFTVELFRNATVLGDGSGHGEGEVFVESRDVTTDASGNANLSFTLNGTYPGQFFSATATNKTTGDTSEFGPGFTAPGQPNLSINDASVTEGNAGTTTATFTVTLSTTSLTNVTVNYATANGTATVGSDYVAKTGTLTIPAGSTTGTITVTVNGDTAFEANETFLVNLSAATNATITRTSGTGTIVNDDGSNIVTTVADNTNAGDGLTTLREAILFANTNPGTTVRFNIPLVQAAGNVFTIFPVTELPIITADGTQIDGFTQTSFTGNTNPAGPEIQLTGLGTEGGSHGLATTASDGLFRGLIINNFRSGTFPDGIILANSAARNRIESNYIGTDPTGTLARPNGFGIYLADNASNNTVGGVGNVGNIIAFNSEVGVIVDPAGQGNIIRNNSVFGNGTLGIDLTGTDGRPDGPTPNDAGDLDTGANGKQNYPVLNSAVPNGTILALSGTLTSKPNTAYTVEIFRNAAADSSGFGEGQKLVTSFSLTTNGAGVASINTAFSGTAVFNGAPGECYAATATGPDGTSEFSRVIAASATATLSFAPTPLALTEGGSSTVTLTRSGSTSAALTVNLTDNSARLTTPASVTIGAGQSATTLTLAAPGNAVVDGNAAVTVTATATGYTNGTLPVTVNDDDTLALALNFAASLREGDPDITGSVARNSASVSTALTVTLAASAPNQLLVNGAAPPATVTIPAGSSSASFLLRAVNDTVPDGNPTVNLTATASGYTAAVRSVVVNDNDGNKLSYRLTGRTVREGGTGVTATLTRTAASIAAPLVATINASPAGQLVVPVSVTFPAGAATVSFPVRALDNALAEYQNIVNLTASSPGFIGAAVTVTVVDNDPRQLTLTVLPANFREDAGPNAAIATVRRNSANNSAALTVNLRSSNTTVATVPATVTIAAGSATATFPVAAVNNAIAEGQRTPTITASAATFAAGSKLLTVSDDDTNQLGLSFSASSATEGGPAITGTLTRNTRALAATTVNLVGTPSGQLSFPATVVMPAGVTRINFSLSAVNDTAADGNVPVTIAASAGGFAPANADVTAVDDERPSLTLSLSASSVIEGAGPLTGTVSRNVTAGPSLVVSLTANPTGQINLPLTVTIPAGALSANFTINVVNDAVAEASPLSLLLTAAAAEYNSGTARLELVDDDETGSNLFAWGYNEFGQVGDGTTTNRNLVKRVLALNGVRSFHGGGSHSLAVLDDATVRAWGYNGGGQLGDGSSTNRTSPVSVADLTDVRGVAAGWYHSLAVKHDGSVWAWGYNNLGQVGDGTSTSRSRPVRLASLSGVIAVAASVNSSYALKSDGTVWAWGNNFYGQLGDGTTTSRNAPVQVSGLTGITWVSAEGGHCLFLKSDGTVWSVGWNSNGQLGNGGTTDSATARPISGLSGVVSVAAGYVHSVAATSSGAVFSWGFNGSGQLGTGNQSPSRTPIRVNGITTARAVEAGYGHSMARLANGTLAAWGLNFWGSLGDGTNTDRLAPVPVLGLADVTAIGAGYGHGLALSGLSSPVFAAPAAPTSPSDRTAYLPLRPNSFAMLTPEWSGKADGRLPSYKASPLG